MSEITKEQMIEAYHRIELALPYVPHLEISVTGGGTEDVRSLVKAGLATFSAIIAGTSENKEPGGTTTVPQGETHSFLAPKGGAIHGGPITPPTDASPGPSATPQTAPDAPRVGQAAPVWLVDSETAHPAPNVAAAIADIDYLIASVRKSFKTDDAEKAVATIKSALSRPPAPATAEVVGFEIHAGDVVQMTSLGRYILAKAGDRYAIYEKPLDGRDGLLVCEIGKKREVSREWIRKHADAFGCFGVADVMYLLHELGYEVTDAD